MAVKWKVEHLIHNKDGTIGQRDSYGSDPRRCKGWPGGGHRTVRAALCALVTDAVRRIRRRRCSGS
jgi:hypothetical protein